MTRIFKTISAVLCAALLSLSLSAQTPWRAGRLGTLGMSIDGGTAWAFGTEFENISASEINQIQPALSAALHFNIKPWVRLSLGYSWSRIVREQFFSSLQPETGDIYRDFKSNLHSAGFKSEFDLLGIGSGLGIGRISLYAGTGAGCTFGMGNVYAISVKNELSTDKMVNTVTFTGHNDRQDYIAAYVPTSLSLEVSLMPQITLRVGTEYRWYPGSTGYAPGSQLIATAGLKFDICK